MLEYSYFNVLVYYTRMKIPNYDNNKKENTKRRLNDFLDEEYRLLVCRQSNCGKTNTVIHMLRKPLVYFDKIHYFGPNSQQCKIQDLIQIMDEISDKVGYPVLEIGTADDIKDTSEYPINNRKVVIFDDLVNAPERVQNKIANHFTEDVTIKSAQFI